LGGKWRYEKEGKRIVIVCGQSRVRSDERVHCVGYSSGETAWLLETEIAKLQLRDFIVLPKIRYRQCLTRRECRGCHRCVPCAGSLRLGR
jgi:hypothetical protein